MRAEGRDLLLLVSLRPGWSERSNTCLVESCLFYVVSFSFSLLFTFDLNMITDEND